MSDSLAQLAQALQRFADARDWGPFHAPKNLASALVVEAGELLEPFQWLTEAQSRELPPDTKEAVALEMADVLLYLVQLANVLDVDLVDAAQRKMVINARKYPVVRCACDITDGGQEDIRVGIFQGRAQVLRDGFFIVQVVGRVEGGKFDHGSLLLVQGARHLDGSFDVALL